MVDLYKGHWIDTAWKKVLSDCADDAIDFFLPELSKDRDKSRELGLIQDELPAIDSDSDKDARIADVCFYVPIKTGEFHKIGCVVEQQHDDDKDFAKRMFKGFYRLSDHLNDDVTALAIFTGDSKDRDEYKYSCYGVNLLFRYNTYHVRSQDIDCLKKDERVFAPVVLAAYMMLSAKGDPQRRENYAKELLKIMRERGYDNKKTRAILLFIGHILRLQDDDIDSNLKGEFLMRIIPLSEHQKQSENDYIEYIQEAKTIEVARNFLADGIAPGVVAKNTGLLLENVMTLMN
ncbi:hypothetical protein AGMMS50276_19170 [Synergistales bacterium]|nr:hypothetical protein AGMMS50276_19170 [Synergistales bacterium]